MNKAWLKATGVRALKAFAQSVLSAGFVLPTISSQTDWLSAGWTLLAVLITGAGAGVVSLLMSIRSLPDPPTQTPTS